METLAIDVCNTQETRIQGSSYVIRLTFRSIPSAKFHLELSLDPKAAASGVADVGVALSERTEAALRCRLPVDSRLRVMKIGGSCKEIAFALIGTTCRLSVRTNRLQPRFGRGHSAKSCMTSYAQQGRLNS